MLPAVLAITHTLTTYYIFSGLAVKGLNTPFQAAFNTSYSGKLRLIYVTNVVLNVLLTYLLAYLLALSAAIDTLSSKEAESLMLSVTTLSSR